MTNLSVAFWQRQGLELEDAGKMAETYRENIVLWDWCENPENPTKLSRKYIKLQWFHQWNKLGILCINPDEEFPCF